MGIELRAAAVTWPVSCSIYVSVVIEVIINENFVIIFILKKKLLCTFIKFSGYDQLNDVYVIRKFNT